MFDPEIAGKYHQTSTANPCQNHQNLQLKFQPEGSRIEVDASFTMTLNVIPAEQVAAVGAGVDDEAREAARRGVAFRGGMTFCPAEEAGESVGRCEDWACRPAHRT